MLDPTASKGDICIENKSHKMQCLPIAVDLIAFFILNVQIESSVSMVMTFNMLSMIIHGEILSIASNICIIGVVSDGSCACEVYLGLLH